MFGLSAGVELRIDTIPQSVISFAIKGYTHDLEEQTESSPSSLPK
jgi:hypothetical protein